MARRDHVETFCTECVSQRTHIIECSGGEPIALECVRCDTRMKPSAEDLNRISRANGALSASERARRVRYANGIPDAGR